MKRGRIQKAGGAPDSEESWGPGWPGDEEAADEGAGANPKAVAAQAAASAAAKGQGRYKCIKATLLQDGFEVKGAKSLRKVEEGEIIECLEAPRVSADYGLSRIKGRAEKDGVVGWITAWGNLGTQFLSRVAETKHSSRLVELAAARKAARVVPRKIAVGGGASSSAGSGATPLSKGTGATRRAVQRPPAAAPWKGSGGGSLRVASGSAEGHQPATALTKDGANSKLLPRCRTPLCPYSRNTDETMDGLCCRLCPEGDHGKRCEKVPAAEPPYSRAAAVSPPRQPCQPRSPKQSPKVVALPNGKFGADRTWEFGDPLPEGWDAYWSDDFCRPFFWHRDSEEAAWELPSEQLLKKWQTELDDGSWVDLPAHLELQLRKAVADGESTFHFRARSFQYVIDVAAGTQTNLKTGKSRLVREVKVPVAVASEAGSKSELSRHTLEELQTALRQRGLNTEGKKYTLVQRLFEAGREENAAEQCGGNPSCFFGESCIGTTDEPLVRHILDDQLLDVYCKACFKAEIVDRPALQCIPWDPHWSLDREVGQKSAAPCGPSRRPNEKGARGRGRGSK